MYMYGKKNKNVLHKYHAIMTVHMYGKKNKNKNKNYSKNNVILSLWSKTIGITSFRVDTQVDILC